MPIRLNDRSWYAISVAALTLAVFFVSSLLAILSPVFRAPDETRHFNSVLRVMQGGGWPAPGTSVLVDGTDTAVWESGAVPWDQPVTLILPTKLPAFSQPGLPAAADRSVVFDQNGTSSTQIDQMTQHPPLYYYATAGVLKVLGGDGWRWDQLILGMRVMSAFLVALAVPFIIGAARIISRSRSGALTAAAAAMLCIPMITRIGGAVNNDNLLIAAGSAFIYFIIRALRRPGQRALVGSTIGIGLSLGIGLLAKGFMLFAIPVAAIALLIAGWRAGTRVVTKLLPAAGALALAFAVGGWWWLRNLILYGVLQPSMGDRRAVNPDFEASLFRFLKGIVKRFSNYFWGFAGSGGIIEVLLTIALFVVVIVALLISKDRWLLLLIAILPAAILVVNVRHSWTIYHDTGLFMGTQGRYMFVALGLIVACLAMAWQFVIGWMGVRGQRIATASVLALVFAALAVSVVLRFRVAWLGAGDSWSVGWQRMLAAGASSAGWFIAIALLASLAYVIAAIGAVSFVTKQQPSLDDAMSVPPATGAASV